LSQEANLLQAGQRVVTSGICLEQWPSAPNYSVGLHLHLGFDFSRSGQTVEIPQAARPIPD